MNIVRCEPAHCYLSRECDRQTIYAWDPGEWESFDGYFSLLDGSYCGQSLSKSNSPFPMEMRQAITHFIVTHNEELQRQFDLDYFQMPPHFHEVHPSDARDLLAMYQPYFPNWRISAQLENAKEKDLAYRWNRDFFSSSVVTPIGAEEVAKYREEYLRDVWEQYFAVDSTYNQFLKSADAKESNYCPAEEPSQIWSIDGIESLYLRRFRRAGANEETAEYLWIENHRARRIHGAGADEGGGRIPYLL